MDEKAQLFWVAKNPKDPTRTDIAMYDGRKVEFHTENAPAGKYSVLAECLGKGITSLRHISLELKVIENGQVIATQTGLVSPSVRKVEWSFVIQKIGKVDLVCVGVAAHSIVSIHFSVSIYRTPKAPLSSSISIPHIPVIAATSSTNPSAYTLIIPPTIPATCWSRVMSNTFADHKEFSVTPYEAMRLAGLGLRMKQYIDSETAQGRIPIMNPFKKSPAGPRMVRGN
jgi:hypothetical protein